MKFYHHELILEVPDSVYYPAEDSLLLASVLEKEGLKGKKALEMGCGSGFLSIVMAKKGAKITSVDISRAAIEATELNAKNSDVSLVCITSDLFSVVTRKFDLIVFNPPYLPEPFSRNELTHSCASSYSKNHREKGSIQWSGGRTGRDVIERFVEQAKAHMNNNGKILLLISSLTGEKEILNMFHTHEFETRIATRNKIPWEELMVIEARL